MTTFKSQQVNLDPEPYVSAFEPIERSAMPNAWAKWHMPRPEFEPTRDPRPWLAGTADVEAQRFDFEQGIELRLNGMELEWAPRREQFDTPVNRVLTDLRTYIDQRKGTTVSQGTGLAARKMLEMLSALSLTVDFTPAEIDHARPILERLANQEGVK